MQSHRTRIIKQRLEHKQAPMTHRLDMLRMQRRSVRSHHDHRRCRIDPREPDEAPCASRVDAHIEEHGFRVLDHPRDGFGLRRGCGVAAHDAERELDELGDPDNWCGAGVVGGEDVDGFEFRTAERLVAGTVDADGGDLDFRWAGAAGRVVDVEGGEGT